MTLRRAGLVTLLVGGAMVLSGCWGIVVNPFDSRQKALVIKADVTRQLVYVHCGGRTGDSGAICVLAAVRRLCRTVPLHGDPRRNLSSAECTRLTSPGIPSRPNTWDMQLAIQRVIREGDACLVGYVGSDVNPPHGRFWTSSPRGFACG